MSEHDAQAEHARLFGVVARQLMTVAAQFAQDVAPTLTPWDVARLYLGTGAWLAAGLADRAGAVELLRSLADSLDRRDDQAKPN